MKKMIVSVLAVSTCLLLFAGCKKEIPGGETEPVAQVEKTQSPPEEVEVVSDNGPDKINLKILYAGLLDTDRQKDFVKFLSGHFKEVGITDYLNFNPAQSEGFDVVILDHDGSDTRAPTPDLPRDYSQAMVTMGVPGADIGSRMGLKTAYL